MPDWETIKRVVKTIFAALGLLAFIVWGIGLFTAACNDGAPLRQFTAGLYFSCALWVLGFLTLSVLVGGQNSALWHLTPLTPRLLVRQAVRDGRMALVTLFIGVPTVAVLTHTVYREGPPDGAGVPHAFVVAGLLFYAVCYAVPLCELTTGSRRVTAPVFALRHVVRRLWFVVIPAVIATQVAANYSQTVSGYLTSALDALLHLGPAAHVAAFVLSPMSGIAMASASPDTLWLVWTFVAFLAIVLVWSLRGVLHAIRPLPADQVCDTPFARWLAEHSAGAWEDASEDGDDEEGAAPAGRAELPYDPVLPPENQILRHAAHWKKRVPPEDSRPHQRMFAWVSNNLWLSVVIAMWCAGLAFYGREEMWVMVLCTALILPLIAVTVRAKALRESITMCVTLPLRWTHLLPKAYLHTLARVGIADLLYAVLVGTLCLSFMHPGAVLGLFGILAALRLAGFMCQWLEAVRNVGRWWLSWSNLALYITLFLAAIHAIARFDLWTKNGATDSHIAAGVALFVFGMVLIEVAVAAFLTWVVFRRDGSSVLGYVALPKEDA
ncbi:MAG: hypothetical protein GY851_06670 [bacterium]|nr:hypothetical protein [bacterium]